MEYLSTRALKQELCSRTLGEKSKKDDDSLNLSSFRSKQKGIASRLKVVRPMQESLKKAVDYFTCRLISKSKE